MEWTRSFAIIKKLARRWFWRSCWNFRRRSCHFWRNLYPLFCNQIYRQRPKPSVFGAPVELKGNNKWQNFGNQWSLKKRTETFFKNLRKKNSWNQSYCMYNRSQFHGIFCKSEYYSHEISPKNGITKKSVKLIYF